MLKRGRIYVVYACDWANAYACVRAACIVLCLCFCCENELTHSNVVRFVIQSTTVYVRTNVALGYFPVWWLKLILKWCANAFQHFTFTWILHCSWFLVFVSACKVNKLLIIHALHTITIEQHFKGKKTIPKHWWIHFSSPAFQHF